MKAGGGGGGYWRLEMRLGLGLGYGNAFGVESGPECWGVPPPPLLFKRFPACGGGGGVGTLLGDGGCEAMPRAAGTRLRGGGGAWGVRTWWLAVGKAVGRHSLADANRSEGGWGAGGRADPPPPPPEACHADRGGRWGGGLPWRLGGAERPREGGLTSKESRGGAMVSATWGRCCL